MADGGDGLFKIEHVTDKVNRGLIGAKFVRRTRLVLVYDGFTRPVDISDYPFGWQRFMEEIAKVAQAEAA